MEIAGNIKVKLEQQYTLRALDVDVKGEWMPSAIFVRMQEIAEDHAARQGVGRGTLVEERGLAWVLTRMSLSMSRYPVLGDTIHAATWPLTPTKLTFLREFLFWDDKGELGRASSQWVLLDIDERMLRRTSAIGDYEYDPAAPALLPEPGKIMLPGEMPLAQTRTVLYSDVDMNRHMNNTKYLNWICELFPDGMLQTARMKTAKLNYIAEAQMGQRVDLFLAEGGGGFYTCGKTGEKTVFDAFIEWDRTGME